jgi:hypothetical protein
MWQLSVTLRPESIRSLYEHTTVVMLPTLRHEVYRQDWLPMQVTAW